MSVFFLHRAIFMAPVLESLLSFPWNVVQSLLVLISCPTAAGVAPWTSAYWDTTAFSVTWGQLSHQHVTMIVWWQIFSNKVPCSFSCCQSSCLCQLVVDACSTPDIVGITVFVDFWFLIHGFSGIISLTLQFNLKIYIYSKFVVTWRNVIWRNVMWQDVTEPFASVYIWNP